jgi:hypothetical protein
VARRGAARGWSDLGGCEERSWGEAEGPKAGRRKKEEEEVWVRFWAVILAQCG